MKAYYQSTRGALLPVKVLAVWYDDLFGIRVRVKFTGRTLATRGGFQPGAEFTCFGHHVAPRCNKRQTFGRLSLVTYNWHPHLKGVPNGERVSV